MPSAALSPPSGARAPASTGPHGPELARPGTRVRWARKPRGRWHSRRRYDACPCTPTGSRTPPGAARRSCSTCTRRSARSPMPSVSPSSPGARGRPEPAAGLHGRLSCWGMSQQDSVRIAETAAESLSDTNVWFRAARDPLAREIEWFTFLRACVGKAPLPEPPAVPLFDWPPPDPEARLTLDPDVTYCRVPWPAARRGDSTQVRPRGGGRRTGGDGPAAMPRRRQWAASRKTAGERRVQAYRLRSGASAHQTARFPPSEHGGPATIPPVAGPPTFPTLPRSTGGALASGRTPRRAAASPRPRRGSRRPRRCTPRRVRSSAGSGAASPCSASQAGTTV